MKVRVTLMTENEKPYPADMPKKVMEEIARGAWEMTVHLLKHLLKSEDKVKVEKIEIIDD